MVKIFARRITLHRGPDTTVVILVVGIVPVQVGLLIVTVPIGVRHVPGGFLALPIYIILTVATAKTALVCYFHPSIRQLADSG
ncbi:MAG: hypothetical protein BWY68_00697 [bacterium ADurb.Bin400]|nr:MAG: hypothetical protein BWY68_00697 [bacterium ADurb.Bin400]